MSPPQLVVESTVYPGLTFVVALALSLEAAERKLAARLQNRMGPSYTGLWGLLQPLFDILKLLGKEDLAPRSQDPVATPVMLVLSLGFAASASLFIPWNGATSFSFYGDAILVSVCLVLSTGLLYLAAYSTHSPFNVVGGLRLLGLLASYEVALLSLLAVPYAATGSLELAEIRSRLWSSLASKPILIPVWLAGLLLGFLLILVESGRNPFSIAEAETEIAGGVVADMSGRRLAFAHLAHSVQSTVAVYYYTSMFIAPPLSGLLGLLALLAAGAAVALAVVLVAAASPRLRLIDVGEASWGIIVPASFFLAAVALAAGW